MIAGTIECPSSHKFVINEGLTCCDIKTSQHFSDQYYDPKDKCNNLIDCPDQRRKCKNAPGSDLTNELLICCWIGMNLLQRPK